MSKLFYKMCAFVWITNDITMGENIQKYQDAVITDVFGYKDKRDFLRKGSQLKYLLGTARIEPSPHMIIWRKWPEKSVFLDHWLQYMGETLSSC